MVASPQGGNMLGGAEGRGRLFAWLGAKESFFGIFYLKIRTFLSSPKKIAEFNEDFIS